MIINLHKVVGSTKSAHEKVVVDDSDAGEIWREQVNAVAKAYARGEVAPSLERYSRGTTFLRSLLLWVACLGILGLLWLLIALREDVLEKLEPVSLPSPVSPQAGASSASL